MKEELKNTLTAMYCLFSTMNERVYFNNSNNRSSYIYNENGKLTVSGGGVETHTIDINNEKDMSILACAFYSIFA